MKIRAGFVSNSSSSSFVCDVCGRSEAGWDSQAEEDFGMTTCVNEHMFCVEEALEDLTLEIIEKDKEKAEEKEEENWDDYWRGMEEKYCPICNFIIFSDTDLKLYLKKIYKVKDEDVLDEIKKSNKKRKKAYNSEYIMYVCKENNLNREKMCEEIKEKYKTYKDFNMFIRE